MYNVKSIIKEKAEKNTKSKHCEFDSFFSWILSSGESKIDECTEYNDLCTQTILFIQD